MQGTDKRPRLSVYRSGKHIYAQIIDDGVGKTLISASDLEIKTDKKEKSLKKEVKAQDKDKKAIQGVITKTMRAAQVGELIAKKALKKKIKKVVFDRGGNRYHGRVKALADGARKGGLEL